MKKNPYSISSGSLVVEVSKLPELHDDKDTAISKGVSAMFSGVIGDQLIVAGGCNFPHIPVVLGGEKQYYETIYSFPIKNKDNGEWRVCGTLPKPLAYGASVSCDEGILCIGGMNKLGSQPDVFMLTMSGEKIKPMRYPSLPKSMDNMYATIIDKKVYVGGGNIDDKPSFELYMLDLENMLDGWTSVAYLPDGPRIQPVMVSAGGRIYLWGGFCPAGNSSEAYFKPGGYAFDPETRKWNNVATPSCLRDGEMMEIFLTGGVGTVLADSLIVCTGGVNLKIFQNAINGLYDHTEYLSHPKDWYRFNRVLMVYDTRNDKWSVLGTFEEFARAGAGIAKLDDSTIFIIQGETKPGIRTPLISRVSIRTVTENNH